MEVPPLTFLIVVVNGFLQILGGDPLVIHLGVRSRSSPTDHSMEDDVFGVVWGRELEASCGLVRDVHGVEVGGLVFGDEFAD